MHAHRDLLQLAGTFLAGVPSASIEWSLQVTGRRAVVRDRVLFWTGRHGRSDNPDAFARIGAFLRELGAPGEMLAVQRRLASHSIRQGIGLVPGNAEAEVCLYIHHVEPGSGIEHCDAWKWGTGKDPEHSFYEFHFLPATPAGMAPIDLIHEDLRPLYRFLESDERVRALSGFWLRHRGHAVDQISLTYAWQPAIGDFVPAMERLLPLDAQCMEDLKVWHGHHFRHVAMNAPDAAEPALTFYFSGDLRGPWPTDVAEVHEQVRQSAHHASIAVEEQIFARLPQETRITTIGAEARNVEDDAELLTRLAPQLSDVIRPGAAVYVIGCGWGPVGAFLAQTRHCRVVGITADRGQYAHCASRGLRTRYGRSDQTLPPGKFDSILVLDGTVNLDALRVFSERILVRMPEDRLIPV